MPRVFDGHLKEHLTKRDCAELVRINSVKVSAANISLRPSPLNGYVREWVTRFSIIFSTHAAHVHVCLHAAAAGSNLGRLSNLLPKLLKSL